MSTKRLDPNQKPPYRGQIFCDDLVTVKLWVRVFGLEERVAEAQALIQARIERKKGTLPIISECHVSSELHWYYVIVLDVDTVGLCGGCAVVFYADDANKAEAKSRRDRFADAIMAQLEERHGAGKFDEIVEIEPGRKTL